MSNFKTTGYVALLAVFALDQLIKHIMLPVVMAGAPVAVAPFFNLVLVWNQGISFGMLQHGHAAAPYILSSVALVISIILHRWLRRAENRLAALGLGLVIGGALGNVVDRLRFGAVFDFLDFYAGAYHWPAFNVADASICIGVGMLVLGGSRKSA